MDIGKAITFFTEDERWLEKLAIGAGLGLISVFLSPVLIGVVGFLIIAGYCVRLLQNVRDGNSQPLPEWNQWGEDLIRGFKLAVVSVVWALPTLVFYIPMAIGGAMTDNQGGAAETIGGLILACGGCLVFLYSIAVALMTPGFTIAYARDEEIRSGLQLTEIWNWTRQNLGPVAIVVIVYIVGSGIAFLVAGLVGIILCGIGLLVTLPAIGIATSLAQYHLYGQLAREFPLSGVTTSSIVTPVSPVTPASPYTPTVTPDPVVDPYTENDSNTPV